MYKNMFVYTNTDNLFDHTAPLSAWIETTKDIVCCVTVLQKYIRLKN